MGSWRRLAARVWTTAIAMRRGGVSEFGRKDRKEKHTPTIPTQVINLRHEKRRPLHHIDNFIRRIRADRIHSRRERGSSVRCCIVGIWS